MKYAIKGLEKSKTIKDIKVNEGKNIEVKYLNGNSDIIEYTEENLKKVIETMTTQAKCFVKCFGDIHLLFAAALACCFWMLSIPGMIFLVLGDAILPIAFLVMAAISGCGFLICKSIENYHQKYTLYIENNFQEVINKYRDIISKEKILGKKFSSSETKKTNLKNISDLDKYSLQDLKEIKEKVSRYSKLVEQKIDMPINEEFQEEKGRQKIKK